MSTTYHLWHNGTDSGPYTREEILGKLRRGELVGILWRRTGATQFQPHTDLAAELEPPEETPTRSATSSAGFGGTSATLNRRASADVSEPSGRSGGGMVIVAIGGVMLAIGLVVALGSSAAAGGALIGASFSCFVVGVLLQINSKLTLIAYRLRK